MNVEQTPILDLVEGIAATLHEGWMRDKLSKGWTLGQRDTARKTHPHLVPWRDINDEKTRNQDRIQASLILQAWVAGKISKEELPKAIHEYWTVKKLAYGESHVHAKPYEIAHKDDPGEHAIQAELVWPLLPPLSATCESIKRALDLIAGKSNVVVASGCFDILHIGHIRHLKRARKMGEALIVLISDDLSVAEIKGPGRPIITAGQRAELLESLRFVDAAIVHRQCEFLAVVREISPAIFVKGPDTEVVLSENEIAKLVPRIERVCDGDPPNIHTSDIIRRCQGVTHTG